MVGIDPDGGSIGYSISGPVFSVDRDTGVVRLRQELDREKQDTIEAIISMTGELDENAMRTSYGDNFIMSMGRKFYRNSIFSIFSMLDYTHQTCTQSHIKSKYNLPFACNGDTRFSTMSFLPLVYIHMRFDMLNSNTYRFNITLNGSHLLVSYLSDQDEASMKRDSTYTTLAHPDAKNRYDSPNSYVHCFHFLFFSLDVLYDYLLRRSFVCSIFQM